MDPLTIVLILYVILVLVNPDFAAYTTGCGALGLKVKEKEELFDRMKELIDHDGPGLLEIITEVGLI